MLVLSVGDEDNLVCFGALDVVVDSGSVAGDWRFLAPSDTFADRKGRRKER